MNALNLAALKRQLTTLSDEYSGLSPQVVASIAADALEVITAAEAKIAEAIELTSYVDECQSGQDVAIAVLNALRPTAVQS